MELFNNKICQLKDLLRMGETCNVAWSSYSDHVTGLLHDLIASNEYTDVTLVCSDKVIIQAHKIVLSSCSQFFNTILKDTNEVKPIIYLKGIQSSEISHLLQFIYRGETSFPQDLTNGFISAANELEIKAFTNESLGPEDGIDKKSQPHFEGEHKDIDGNKIQLKGVIACKNQTEGEIINDFTNATEMPQYDQKNIKLSHQATKNEEDLSKEEQIIYDTDEVMLGMLNDGDLINGNVSKMDSLINCLQCDKEFFDMFELKQHISISHNNVKNMCDICGFKSSKTNAGRAHIIIHKISKHDFKLCTKCEYISASQHDITEHELEDHNMIVAKMHKCQELKCSFSCNNKRIMKLHQWHHIRTQNEEIGEHQKEQECENQNTSIANINHLAGKISSMPVEVEERYTIEENGQSNIYSCKECEYQNPKKINIKRHIESKHLGISFPCEQCGYLAQRMPILRDHIASVHEKSFKFKCKKCEKSFNSYNALQIHEKSIHQGITYPCTLCRSVFTRPCNLYKHKKKYH